jgi:hypothetical protein
MPSFPVVDRPSSGGPPTLSHSASIRASLYRIGCCQAFVFFSCSVLICLSWLYHSDWQEQIVVVAADVVEPDAMEPNIVEPEV